MPYTFSYIGLCLIIGLIGRKHKFGFWGHFFPGADSDHRHSAHLGGGSTARRMNGGRITPRAGRWRPPRRGWLSSSKNLNLVNDSLPIPVQTPGFLGWEAAEAFDMPYSSVLMPVQAVSGSVLPSGYGPVALSH